MQIKAICNTQYDNDNAMPHFDWKKNILNWNRVQIYTNVISIVELIILSGTGSFTELHPPLGEGILLLTTIPIIEPSPAIFLNGLQNYSRGFFRFGRGYLGGMNIKNLFHWQNSICQSNDTVGSIPCILMFNFWIH